MELDYTKEKGWVSKRVDLVWCCEFVEHIPEEDIVNFLRTFKAGKYVAITHAGPGQPGHNHVNCQTDDYWRGVMAVIGFKLDPFLTKCGRLAASTNTTPWNHFKRSGLIFTKYDDTKSYS
jgi:hypothetical protein